MKTEFQIWYMRPEQWQTRRKPTAKNLGATHIHLKNIVLDGGAGQLNRVYHDMQGEIWSPNGEARPVIEALGLSHTSMSVGDIIVADGMAFEVVDVGFKELGSVEHRINYGRLYPGKSYKADCTCGWSFESDAKQVRAAVHKHEEETI